MGHCRTGIAGEQAFFKRSFAGANTYFGGWETTEYERDQITKSLVSVDIDRDGVMNLRLSPAPPSRSLTAAVCCPGILGVSADTYALFVSKLTVYKNSGGTFKKISQKKLMTLNREDEKEDGNRYYDHIRFPNITTARRQL